MMVQLPLSELCPIVVGKNGEQPRWENVVVWASLVLGQPLCIMMHYHDCVITQYGPQFVFCWTVTVNILKE
jgi:diacylglycerol O-acyltransferase-1